jgi:quercetin dioxygenase-like cupin family protein
MRYEKEGPMKRNVTILVTVMALGAALGAIGTRIVIAQQGAESRAVLLTQDLVGLEGHEVRMWRTDIGPGGAGAKHYHPGTECICVPEGALTLDEGGRTVQLKAGDAHGVPPKTVLVPRNASGTAPYKSVVVMIAPKGQPLAVPVKD